MRKWLEFPLTSLSTIPLPLFGKCALFWALVLDAPVCFFAATTHSLPVGEAGLYALMSELVVANRFALPSEVPFYGPGGIPFAYPPVAFCLAAFSTALLDISIYDSPEKALTSSRRYDIIKLV